MYCVVLLYNQVKGTTVSKQNGGNNDDNQTGI